MDRVIIKTIEVGEHMKKGFFARHPDEQDSEVYGETLELAIKKYFEIYSHDCFVGEDDIKND